MDANGSARKRTRVMSRTSGSKSAVSAVGSVSGGGSISDTIELKDFGSKDQRAAWMLSLIADYFRSHTLDKFSRDVDNIKTLKAFLDAAEANRTLFVVEKAENTLVLSDTAPSTKSKVDGRMLYFTKSVDGAVSSEGDHARQILVGDCNLDPVQQLEQVTQDVFMPLLSNSQNQESWSEAVRKELMDNMHGFVSSVQIASGLMRGETFLPLPNMALLPGDESVHQENGEPDVNEEEKEDAEDSGRLRGPRRENDGGKKSSGSNLLAAAAASAFNGVPTSPSRRSMASGGLTASAPSLLGSTGIDGAYSQSNNHSNPLSQLARKEQVHVFEGCLITWTKQIKNVLRMDPEYKLKQGLNPLPSDELEFWHFKAANLNSIFEQLQSPRVRKVLQFLDQSKSTYNTPFAKLCKESFEARDEANSNVSFLAPLEPWLLKLEDSKGGGDLEDICSLFKPIMHLVLLVWKNSPFYKSIARLVVLMREVSNAVISRCVQHLDGPKLFALIEGDDHGLAYAEIKKILRVIGCFKSAYFDYKARANAECTANPWRVQNTALFGRLDVFLERCHDLLDLTQTISHFSKLNKVEIGGTKGKTLTTSVHQVHNDFEHSVAAIKDLAYDVMDVDAKQFDDDFYEFRVKAKELERRIASVLSQGFDDCATVAGRFKLLDSFDQVLERPIIREELEQKHLALLVAYGQDLSSVQHEFLELRDDPPVPPNMPPIAGALAWCRGLSDRIAIPMAQLRDLGTSVLEREGARDVIKNYTALVANLADYEHQKVKAWEESIESSSISKLRLPLLRWNTAVTTTSIAIATTDETMVAPSEGQASSGDSARPTAAALPQAKTVRQLCVNFDPALVQLLREVKYFLLMKLDVPGNALSIYERVEQFRRETGNLELIVQKYNKIKATLLPVEKPLIQNHLNKIDKVINQGLKTLTWKSHGIETFITEAIGAVEEADEIISTMKSSLEEVDILLDQWSDSSMIHRGTKPVSVEEFNQTGKREKLARYALITEGGKEIHRLLKDIVKKLKVSAGLPDWKAYVDFVNNIVIAGLVRTANVSLRYLSRELDLDVISSESKLPLIEVDLILSSRMVLFSPVLQETSKEDGIRDEVKKWIETIFHVGSLFKRLDSPHGTYLKEIQQDPSVMEVIAAISRSQDKTIGLAESLQSEYHEYKYLWTTDLNSMFSEFLQTAFHPKRPEDDDDLIDTPGIGFGQNGEGTESDDDEENIPDGVGEAEGSRPNLDVFDERINHFQELRVTISELPPSRNIGFLRVNTQPIKQALSTWVTKWIYLFTQYLHDYVVGHLRDLHDFMEEVSQGLAFDPEAPGFGDEALMRVMKFVGSVRKRMRQTEKMFVPLSETMALLRKHGISFEGDQIGGISISDFFDNAPDMWDSTVDRAFKAREMIQPKQNLMASKIKRQAIGFNSEIREFRQEFLAKAPFGNRGDVLSNPDLAYTIMQGYHDRLNSFTARAEELRQLEDLFELEQSQSTELVDIETELSLLKVVWDIYSFVANTFESWRPILWDQINTMELEDECRNLARQMGTELQATVHRWPVYEQLERRVNNMAVAIPLVSELHSPAMRDRHWKQIMGATGGTFEKNARFCLQTVLELNLHNFVDQVSEIVEVANKELKIDQKLRSIEDMWYSLSLDYVPHDQSNSDFKVIANPEAIVEALEEHQLQLQTIAGLGKFVDYFRERVTNWQRSLGLIESTLLLWLKVQRSWDSLEKIFLSGSDIRSELPEDTKRFENLDQVFKRLMVEATNTPNAMTACCEEGRYDQLHEMWISLEQCQKALNEYLEQKRKIFPRFYFVSNLALLDILSNGFEPEKIMPHMSACFSGITTLEFLQRPGGTETVSEGSSSLSVGSERRGSVKTGKKISRSDADTAVAMVSGEGERVEFASHFKISGAVESWLNEVTGVMQGTLRHETNRALSRAANWESDRPRDKWLFDFPAQVVLLASQVVWTDECRLAIEEQENGGEDALEKYLALSDKRLRALIELVKGDLSKGDRTKIITLITQDVHGKEVIEKFIERRVESADDFAWQSQLRFAWDDETQNCAISIADFSTRYSFEYVGNVDRLVITPLTDRCYITLTMALRLNLGGAPAGPAGTGKTETTKDLARSLGLPCYVFNCSDQMNYQTIGDIFKGLAQTGAWGCFDEFNRIPVEVLSVVATQVKCILDAIRFLEDINNRTEPYVTEVPAGKPPCKVGDFDFMGTTISLVPTTGFFITMNPGYAGRTELPENLKAQFRSCAMIRPDLRPICENMLMAEGFIEAKPLSLKFVTLYRLSSEMLSQQPHYDWGLRNVKSVLRVAGMLLRQDPGVEESAILMRALRDFNVPKLSVADLPIYLRLIEDLFPGVEITLTTDTTLRDRAVHACRSIEVSKSGGSRGETNGTDLDTTTNSEQISQNETRRHGNGTLCLQPEEAFINKVVNLQEIMDVRHSVMLLGPAGCGKTSIWKTLAAAHNIDAKNGAAKASCVAEVLNPKALTSNELYGFMTLQKDWKDGALSIVMRNMSKCIPPYHSHQTHHWVVLDGDIDAIWIESMNTVMDDNKVLTLVSNERIPLTSKMRMVFEVDTLKNATPATVSRAGILYINASDIGWQPSVDSWVESTNRSTTEKATLQSLFAKNAEKILNCLAGAGLQHVIPRSKIAMIQSVCSILEAIMRQVEPGSATKEELEHLFVFALIWGIGGSLVVDKAVDNRKKFSTIFLEAVKSVSFSYNSDTKAPSGSAPAAASGDSTALGSSQANQAQRKVVSVFDFYYDLKRKCMVPWENKLDRGVALPDSQEISAMIVPTAQSLRNTYLLNHLVRINTPVCLVGSAGTGKTITVKEFLREVSDDFPSAQVNMNYYTDSYALQMQLEQHIDKRSGKIYGPAGDKSLVYFVDDLNMPFVEEYGTQSPIALLRQYIDYHQWYDRSDLGLKREIQDVQLIAAMNQKCGSFTINPRLQRHFSVLALEMPKDSDLHAIYHTILKSHLDNFSPAIQTLTDRCVNASIELANVVGSKFLPGATTFHYNFNMRDLASLFQGLLRARSDTYTAPLPFVRLFLHEATRVYSDRLVNEKDIANFDSILIGVSKKHFEEEQDEMFAKPLIFADFMPSSTSTSLLAAGSDSGSSSSDDLSHEAQSMGGAKKRSGRKVSTVQSSSVATYRAVRSQEDLQAALEGHLALYNQSKAKMDLVLFTLAAEHVCRIARIIGSPGGNALLVGVGGSGKQSLTKLASFVCGYDVCQISITGDYTLADFKENLKGLYRRAGLRPQNGLVLLLTDSQIVDERFLVYVNDVLSSGYVPDLFTADEYDGLFASLRSEAKANSIPSTKSHMMEFFISRVRSALHVVLCHSPVGDAFRMRARKFPGLINCTSIDWFHQWPRDALVAVASRFLGGVALGTDDVTENVMHHIAEVHLTVTESSRRFRQTQGRHNYVTPKSFLEMVGFYKRCLNDKRGDLWRDLGRLKAGLQTLNGTAKDVAKLQNDLKLTMVKVEERKEATEALLEQMGQQRAEAQAQQAIASKERIRAEKCAREAEEIEADAETELAAAQPAMDQAADAVNCLTKASLTELKSLAKPPAGVDKVTTVVLMMVKNEKRNFSWDNAKRMMQNVDRFKAELENYDAKNIPGELIERVGPIVNDPDFTFEKLSKKSSAAANMANWVINILAFNEIYKKVRPLMDRLRAATQSKEEAMGDLKRVEEQLDDAEQRLNELQESFMHATNEKSKVEAEAKQCTDRLELAGRLVNGLSSENERWEKEVETLQYRLETIVGDTLLASAFVSYTGAFDAETRTTLWKEVWTSDIQSREIPLSEGVTPLQILADDAEIAQWGMEGLPADSFSIENGALVISSTRWPLVIDPQLQGLGWIKAHFDKSGASNSGPANSSSVGSSSGSGTDDSKSESIQPGMLQRKQTLNKSMMLKSGKIGTTSAVPRVEAGSLVVLQLSQKNWLQVLTKAIECGATVVIENIGETLDAALEPLLAQSFYFKGKQPFLNLGGQEVEFDPGFKLVLQTRMSNPHYKPELVAQCTLINFIVTEDGLEDQLLAQVVRYERAELETQKQNLQLAFNKYKIQLVELENTLLEKLSNAPADILSDVPLIESLEATKATATEVTNAVDKGKETEKGINEAREAYRPVATEASMLYFLLLQLGEVNHMYQYSLATFLRFFEKSMENAEPLSSDGGRTQQQQAVSNGGLGDEEALITELVKETSPTMQRVAALAKSVRFNIFSMVSRGLFETHKQAFLIQLTFNLLLKEIITLKNPEDRFDAEALDFLLRAPQRFDVDNDIDWLPDNAWQTVCALAEQIPEFQLLPNDMIESAPRFKEWYNCTTPEREKLPLEWRELEKKPFLKILVVRALRPDRVLSAFNDFVRSVLPDGSKYADCDRKLSSFQVLESAFQDTRPDTPIYFILSPGSDVVADVDRLARAQGKTLGAKYHNISLGQGQDVIAMQTIDRASRQGGWVFLNNVHLMPKWLLQLSKKLDELGASRHCSEDFRLFLSSDPSEDIPVSILNRSIKLTNEPPAGLNANLPRSWTAFQPEDVDNLDGKTRSILFALCYFHAAMIERKTYLGKGFNMVYPFSGLDLSACSVVLNNYMDKHNGTKVPWEDLRYLFGEIMYGGHIVNDFDRRVCSTYLEYYMNDKLLDELEMFPFTSIAQQAEASEGINQGDSSGKLLLKTFKVPALPTHEKYVEHIREFLPDDTPLAIGLHPNAELGLRTSASKSMFTLLQRLQNSSLGDDGEGQSPQHIAEAMLQDMLDTYRGIKLDADTAADTVSSTNESGSPDPFQNTYLQECKRMQTLLDEIIRSLEELELGFKGDLTMTDAMERLMLALYTDKVPDAWVRISYPTQRPLGSWLANLQQRITQLQDWLNMPTSSPNVTWIAGFFNPNAFLTALLQTSARATGTELDKLTVGTEVLKRREADVEDPSRDGAYVTGLYLEGATWDFNGICLAEAKPKETICAMPIINCKAEQAKPVDAHHIFLAPVYLTQRRADTYVFTANLRTKLPSQKWTLAGTCLLLDHVE